MADAEQSRRKFLKVATMAIGGAIGAFVALPILRYVFFPVGRAKPVVDAAREAVDVLAADALAAGGPPVRVQITVSSLRDAWSVANNVPLGAAWLRKDERGKLHVLSSTCPHLGCAIDVDSSTFVCPCHKSAFALSGDKISGPSKRGLDPLPATINEGGRVLVEFKRFRPDVPEREEV